MLKSDISQRWESYVMIFALSELFVRCARFVGMSNARWTLHRMTRWTCYKHKNQLYVDIEGA